MSLTDEQREDALDAVALVRLATDERPMEEIKEALEAILADRDIEDVFQLLWSVVNLGGALVRSWYKSLAVLSDEEPDFAPTEVLDSIVQDLIGVHSEEEN